MSALSKYLVMTMLAALVGCSDVTPEVTLLRSKPPEIKTGSYKLTTDLASVGIVSSQDGYQLNSVISKEDKATPVASANGTYVLILDF